MPLILLLGSLGFTVPVRQRLRPIFVSPQRLLVLVHRLSLGLLLDLDLLLLLDPLTRGGAGPTVDRERHAAMEVGSELVASDEEASNLVAGGLDAENLVGLRVEEKARGDGLVCWRQRLVEAHYGREEI